MTFCVFHPFHTLPLRLCTTHACTPLLHRFYPIKTSCCRAQSPALLLFISVEYIMQTDSCVQQTAQRRRVALWTERLLRQHQLS